MANKQSIKILLLEDSPSDARLIQGVLAEAAGGNFIVTWADRLESAIGKLRELPFDIALVDLGLPDSQGKNTYSSIMEAAPTLPVIVLTGMADEALGAEAVHDGVQDYLVKGHVDGATMARSIRYAIERKQAREAAEQLKKELERRAEELESANKGLRESRRAALNLIEDAEKARGAAERVSDELAQDIVERKKAEEKLQKLNRTLMAHSKSSQAMMRARDEKQYLNEVCGIITEDCGYKMVWVGYAENDDAKTVSPVASAGFDEGFVEQLDVTWDDTERGRGPTGTAIRTGKPAGCRNIFTDPNFKPWREEAIKRGYAASMVFPLLDKNRAFGVINIYSKEPESFLDDEVLLLMELSDDLSYGILTIRMQNARALAEETVRKERNFSNAVIQTTGGLIVGMDPEGRIQLFNNACEKTTGYTFDELRGEPLWDYLLLPEETDAVKKVFFGIKEGRIEAESEFENYWVAKDKSRRFIRWTNSALKDEAGNVELIIGTGIDITEDKENRARIDELNSFLMQRTTELMSANKELESFSYSISHDLRAPLRAMKGFSTILMEDYSGKLDAEGREFINRIKSGADKMSGLIDDMLRMAKISRDEMDPKEVDLSAVAASIVNELRQGDKERKVETVIADRIKARCDARLITIALSNLLGNAWKYSSKTPNAVIEFGATVNDGERVYFVRDNGAGFDNAHAKKLFTPFQRLHPESQFSGTGIGLAIVNKIIQRHGGRVWGEGRVGKGATFSFTLALDKKENRRG